MVNILKKELKSKNGSSSILVLFMITALITIGAFTFTSVNVNYKSSRESELWLQNYYEVASMAERYLMEVDKKLMIAEQKAIEYMIDLGFTYEVYEGIQPDVQLELNAIALHANSTEAGNRVVSQRVYMYYAYLGLVELLEQYPNNIIVPLRTDGLIEGIAKESNFHLYEPNENIVNEDFYLRVNLNVMPFRYVVTQNNNIINLNLANEGPRYRINSWNQWNILLDTGL